MNNSGVLCCFCFTSHRFQFLAILKCLIRLYFFHTFWLTLTQIFFQRLYKAHNPELRIRPASGVDCVQANPAPVVTDFDVETISAPYRKHCVANSSIYIVYQHHRLISRAY